MQLLASIQQRMKCPPVKSVHVKNLLQADFHTMWQLLTKEEGKIETTKKVRTLQ